MTTLCFLDTETTSLRHDRRIWEIGLIVRQEGRPDFEHSWFIDPDELDNAFRSLSRFRADLGAVDERFRDARARLIDLRSEQEVLRSVYRSLDDLAAAVAPNSDSTRVRTASRKSESSRVSGSTDSTGSSSGTIRGEPAV